MTQLPKNLIPPAEHAEDIYRVLEAIAQGYAVNTLNDRYITVENPEGRAEPDGSPYLSIDLWQIYWPDDYEAEQALSELAQ